MSVVTLDIVGCSGVVTDEADDGESARLVEAHSSEQTRLATRSPLGHITLRVAADSDEQAASTLMLPQTTHLEYCTAYCFH